jgi:hypothetical protein
MPNNKSPIPFEIDEEFNSFIQQLNSYVMEAITSTMLGRILTMIDASCAPSPQIEALKSLVKQEAWETYDSIWKQNSKLDQQFDIKRR